MSAQMQHFDFPSFVPKTRVIEVRRMRSMDSGNLREWIGMLIGVLIPPIERDASAAIAAIALLISCSHRGLPHSGALSL
jgi:hypothetical protein